MSEHPEHIDPKKTGHLSQEGMMDYLQGKLSHADMYELEKAALEDDFYADALDGLSSISPEELNKDMAALSSQLEKRVNEGEKEKKLLLWPRLAAAVALLIVGSMSIFYFVNQSTLAPEGDLAMKEASQEDANTEEEIKKPQAPTLQRDTIPALSKNPSDKEEISPAPQKQNAIQYTPSKAKQSPATSANTDRAVPQALEIAEEGEISRPTAESNNRGLKNTSAADDKYYAKDENKSEAAVEIEEQDDVAPSLAQEKRVAVSQEAMNEVISRRQLKKGKKRFSSNKAKYDEEIADNQVIEGKVTSKDGEALPGVNVLVKGTNIGAVTDANGEYEISLPPGVETDVLSFSFIGFSGEEVMVKDNATTVNLQMQEELHMLSESIVVGDGADDAYDGPAFVVATPVGGRSAFNKYLEKELQYPQAAQDNQIEGKVTVEFTVQTDGSLSDINIKKSLGYGCDEEALRLIQSGPKWIPARKEGQAISDKMRVKIKFAPR